MIIAPAAYHESMSRAGRNRSHIRILISLTDVQAQATLQGTTEDKQTVDSSLSGLFLAEEYSKAYASWELNRFRLDGTPLLQPGAQDTLKYPYFYQGLIFDALSDEEGNFEQSPTLTLYWNSLHTVYGLTFNFDTILGSIVSDIHIEAFRDGESIAIHDIQNNQKDVLEEVVAFTNFDKLVIEFRKTLQPRRRVRLTYLLMGIGLSFTNNDIVSSTLTRETDLLSAVLPTSVFDFEIDNITGRFDLDDENNAVNFFQARQQVSVMYGYEIENGDTPYWIFGGQYMLTGMPEVDDISLRAQATNILDSMDGEFYKGLYYPEGITLYELAEQVFEDAKTFLPPGVTLTYYIDSFLKSVTTKAPLPVADHKQCLQYIANAGMCTVSIARDGSILLRSAFIPDKQVTDNNHEKYAFADWLLESPAPSTMYVTWEPDVFTFQEGTRLIPPPGEESTAEYCGYVSTTIADAEGSLLKDDGYPEITITFEANFSAYNFTIYFDQIHNMYASEFEVVKYTDGLETESWIEKPRNSVHQFSKPVVDFNKLVLRFKKMSKPNIRLRISAMSLGAETDYLLTRANTAGNPVSKLLQEVATLAVKVPTITESTETEQLFSDEFIVSGRQSIHVSYGDAVFSQVATIEGNGNIISQTHYSYASDIVVETLNEQKITLTVMGKKLLFNSSSLITQAVNATGSYEPLENPLITDTEVAKEYLKWSYNYVVDNKKYEVPFRGDPVIDPLDLIYYETRQRNKILTRVSKVVLNAGQGISGSVTLKEVTQSGKFSKPKDRLGIKKF